MESEIGQLKPLHSPSIGFWRRLAALSETSRRTHWRVVSPAFFRPPKIEFSGCADIKLASSLHEEDVRRCSIRNVAEKSRTRGGHGLLSAILTTEEWHQLFKDFRPKAINLPGKRITKPCRTRMDSRSVCSHFGGHAIYDHPTCQDLSIPLNSAATICRHGTNTGRLVIYRTRQLPHTHCRSLFVRAAAHHPRLLISS